MPKAANPIYCATKAAIHSWTQSLRYQLRDSSVSVHEIVPPQVATDLMPGQSQIAAAMPLKDFTDEVMDILSRSKVPDEVLVNRVNFLRNAEAENRYVETFGTVNGLATWSNEGWSWQAPAYTLLERHLTRLR